MEERAEAMKAAGIVFAEEELIRIEPALV